ncbi:hypothetical protein Aoki45_08290 [Algoriphagus sp. oki45]|uniref:hypothetical protein n=1 Tax=Algoriphagus sp. oki45 TaxID=3067294 RepID=UPI0027ED031F|nr:hypothetical protein Aoki45_08290 [Algoriphagus sp. oki45]
MRVVKEFVKDEVRVSVFSWNNKYLIKFELGPLEQTFKLSEMDVLEESELEAFWSGDFFSAVVRRFEEMGKTFRDQVENL